MWRAIKKIIQQNHNFLITTHLNPDGDGIGAACALSELLIQLGKKVRFITADPIPDKFAFLDYHHLHQIYSNELNLNDAQVLIVLDTHRKERIGAVSELINRKDIIPICIDHHIVTETFTPYIA